MERRVSRATTALFRFKNGLTIGSLTHTILLHEMVRLIRLATQHQQSGFSLQGLWQSGAPSLRSCPLLLPASL